MLSVPRPRHFITRPDGTMTPLIALDEMPDDVRIINVSNTLTSEQTVGMMSMGLEPRSTGKYSVAVTEQESVAGDSVTCKSVACESVAADESLVSPPVPTATKPESVEPASKSSTASTSKDLRHSQHAAQGEPSAPNTQDQPGRVYAVDIPPPAHTGNGNQAAATGNIADPSGDNIIKRTIDNWRQHVGTSNPADNITVTPTHDASPTLDTPTPMAVVEPPQHRQHYAQTGHGSNASVVMKGSQPYNPAVQGVFNRKIYCSHWVRTGECDFMQQGCIFQHVMPDLETLASLGFRHYPRWYRENALMEAGPTVPVGSHLFQQSRQPPFRQPPRNVVTSQLPRPSLTPRLNNIDQTPMYGRPGPGSTYTGSVAQARGSPATWNRWPVREERPGRENRNASHDIRNVNHENRNPNHESRNPNHENRNPHHNRVYQAVNPWANRPPRAEVPAPQLRGAPSEASEWNPSLPPQPFDRVIRNAAPATYQPRDLVTATPSITESVISTMPPSPNLIHTQHHEVNVPNPEPVHMQEAPASPPSAPRVNLPTARPITILARPTTARSTSIPVPPQTTSRPFPNSAPIQVVGAPTPTTAAVAPPSAPQQVTAAPPHPSAAADQTSAPPLMTAASDATTVTLPTPATGQTPASSQVMAAPQTSTSAQVTGGSSASISPQDTVTPPTPTPAARLSRRERTRIYGPQPLPQYPSLRPSPPVFGSAPPAPSTPPKSKIPTHRPLNDLLPEAPEERITKRFVASAFVAPDANAIVSTGDKDGKKAEVSDVRDPAIIAQGNIKDGKKEEGGVYRPGSFGSLGSPTVGRKDRRRRPSDAGSNLMDLNSA
ncbi:mucin 7, secreted [Trapelia coarctata]|nr:mucin 7, secreted [Trapelia coarctata]